MDEFEEMKIDFTPSEQGVSLESIYKADNGFVVSTVCGEGYGGDIKVMVGVDKDFKVANLKIMAMSETAGLA